MCRHIRQTKAEARAADGEGAGELAGDDEPGALNIRRRAAAGRTAQGAVGRVEPSPGVPRRASGASPVCTCIVPRPTPRVPRCLKCRQIVYELEFLLGYEVVNHFYRIFC